jgi:hypothetical protein
VRTILASLVLAAAALAAPVPRHKPRPPVDLAGRWVATWYGSSDWPTVLLPGGDYVAEREGGSIRYEGRWSLKGGVLSIEEARRLPDGMGPVYRYSWKLKPGTTVSECGRLKLARLED